MSLLPPLRCRYFRDPVPYDLALSWQRSLAEGRRSGRLHDDILLLLQHPPTYTLGRGANPDFLKFDPAQSPWAVHRIERGGEVTYHGPGQWVGYPILDLRFYRQDLHWYLRQLEQVVINTLARFGLKGDRLAGLTGVWVDGAKVAAIGIHVSRWVTTHGFALNVRPDLRDFARIVPCGIDDRPVTSMAELLPDIELEAVWPVVVTEFCRVFGRSLSEESKLFD